MVVSFEKQLLNEQEDEAEEDEHRDEQDDLCTRRVEFDVLLFVKSLLTNKCSFESNNEFKVDDNIFSIFFS